MFARFILLTLFLFAPTLANAQYKLVLNEDFNSSGDWPTNDADVEDGKYILEPDADEGELTCWVLPTQLKDKKNYRFETRIRRVSGDAANVVGLLWEANGCETAHSIYISAHGEMQIGYYKEDKFFYYGWQQSNGPWYNVPSARDAGEWNDIVIEKRSDVINYVVNGVAVRQITSFDFGGSGFGFLAYGSNVVEVDYVRVYEDTSSINLVPGALTEGERINMGTAINTVDFETLPVITSDAKTIYVASRPVTDGTSDDIYVSTFVNGQWTQRQNIGSPLNTSGNNSVIAVSADGNSLLMNGILKDGVHHHASRSYRTATGWSQPEPVTITNFENLQGSFSASMSSDGKAIFWGIKDATSIGNVDLYVSFLQPDGSWAQPMNLGPDLNTFAEEGMPYLAADGTTLYFSSEGHPGYGSLDVFVSRRLDDTYKKWSKPQNLGPLVNTEEWDAYFKIDASGDYGVLCSNKDMIGGTDVFRIKLPNAAKPRPLILLNATVLDKRTNAPLAATVKYYDLTTNAELGIARTDPATGSFRLTMPFGVRYAFLASADDHFSVSDTIVTTGITQFTEVTRTMLLSPVVKGETITLSNIFFETDKSELLPESYPSLDRLVQFMQERPTMKIAIAGHTDNVGSDQYNLNLSDSRAKSVAQYLTQKSIDKKRFTAKGFGEAKPVATNDTDPGRQQNRRVEFTIESL